MNMEPEIIFEDEALLVINKPAGLMVHGDGRSDESTLADWLVSHYPDMKEVGEPWENQKGEMIPRPGIVHRLDRDTSGVLLVAKNQEMFEYLKGQFQEHTIQKTYHAFAYGILKEDSGLIDKPIGKSTQDFRQWSAMPGARGKKRDAQTEFKVLSRAKDIIYLELKPKTGRTHQLRVHLKAIHHPIICDKLYAKGKQCLLGLNRVALHASKIEFTLPDGKEAIYEALLPDDFQKALAEMQNM